MEQCQSREIEREKIQPSEKHNNTNLIANVTLKSRTYERSDKNIQSPATSRPDVAQTADMNFAEHTQNVYLLHIRERRQIANRVVKRDRKKNSFSNNQQHSRSHFAAEHFSRMLSLFCQCFIVENRESMSFSYEYHLTQARSQNLSPTISSTARFSAARR